MEKLLESLAKNPNNFIERYKEERIKRARNSLFNFIDYTFKRKQGYQENWHNKAICGILDNFLDDIAFDRLIILSPPRHGKALDINTPILTNEGLKLHGELKPGDYVYNAEGQRVKVLAVTNHYKHSDCYNVVFSTGDILIAAAEHEWVICPKKTIIETKNIFKEKITAYISWENCYTTEVLPCGERIVNCIQVEGGIYLAGEGLIPTHNSEIVSRRLPAYAFGKNPDLEIIACSYSSTLSKRMNRDVQRIMDSREYQEVFPESSLSTSNVVTQAGKYLRNSEILEIVGHTGVYVSSGVGGGIIGMGMDLGILDDPIKNAEEALSKVVRDATWEWFISTFQTRAEKDAKMLITLTRWNEDDIAGRLIKLMKENPDAERWRVINFPAIYEGQNEFSYPEDPRQIGEPLWPWKYDTLFHKRKKIAIGSYNYNAQYQGNPSPAEGNIFNRAWWKFYKERPDNIDKQIQSWDCAFKDKNDNSYVVGEVWAKVGARKYLLDQVRDRMNFPTTKKTLKAFSGKWPLTYEKYIEDKANGPAVIDDLKDEVSGLIPVEPKGSKIARAHAISGDVEAGNCYLPDPSIAPWVHDYIEELAAFPNGAFDDQVDCTTQAISKLRDEGGVMPEVLTKSPRQSQNLLKGYNKESYSGRQSIVTGYTINR